MKSSYLKKYLFISAVFSFVLVLTPSTGIAQKIPPPEEAAGFFANSPTFQTLPVLKKQEQPLVVGKYPEENIVLSGWMLGEKYLQNRAAVVEVPFGKGKIILLGFRVQHRGQTVGTFKLLFNSLFYGAITEK